MGNSQQAKRLCEMLLEQAPACTWMLRRDLTFERVFGISAPLFGKPPEALAGHPLLDSVPHERRTAWQERIERVFRGESIILRERFASGLFSMVHFPMRVPDGDIRYAAGTALEVTAIHAAEQELRYTAINVLKAQETERARLSRFLHDEVGQCLSAAGLQLDLLRMDLECTVPNIRTRTAEVQQVLEGVMQRVREFVTELNPALVERAGLHSALDHLVGRRRRTFPGTLRLLADSSLRLETPVAGALYKITEEAVDNAIRHAGCTLVEVLLKSTRQGPALEVRDNGAGFDPVELNGARRGLGLLLMEHCAAEAGIDLAVASMRGRGTTVTAVYRGPATVAGG